MNDFEPDGRGSHTTGEHIFLLFPIDSRSLFMTHSAVMGSVLKYSQRTLLTKLKRKKKFNSTKRGSLNNHSYTTLFENTLQIILQISSYIILSHIEVTIERVWISEWIY